MPYGESKYYFDTQYHKFKISPIYEEPLISPEYLIIIIVVVSFGSLLLYDNHKLKMEKKAENYKKSCGSVSITSQVLVLEKEDFVDGNISEPEEAEQTFPEYFMPFKKERTKA